MDYSKFDLSKILIVLDGQTELNAFRARFYNHFGCCPSLKKGPGNGINYSAEGYARGVFPILNTSFKLNTRSAIIVVDREKRRVSAKKFSLKLKKEIIKHLLSKGTYNKCELEDKIEVIVPDIMFENWLISDIANIKSHKIISNDAYQKDYDGTNGTTELQRICNTKYKKTTHAPGLFDLVDFEESCSNSPSFKAFFNGYNNLVQKFC